MNSSYSAKLRPWFSYLRPIPIIPEIGICLSGSRVFEFLLPFNHLYQACSGPGLCKIPVGALQLPGSRKICISVGLLEVEIGKTKSWRNTYRGVDLNTTMFVPGGFSCTNSPPACTWRKVMDRYNRNLFSLPKHHIRICRAFCNLGATHCSKHIRKIHP